MSTFQISMVVIDMKNVMEMAERCLGCDEH
jgi:hypothetical protein